MIKQVKECFNANKTVSSTMLTPWALVMDACPMTRHGLELILTRTQFRTEQVMMLNKAADILLCLESDLPAVIIMDLCGDGESVLEGLRVISTCLIKWPFIPLVVCTALTDVHFLQQIKPLNVSSICHKHDPLESIENCIMLAQRGIHQDSPTVQKLLSGERNILSSLTKKELEVLVYLLGGSSVSAMSRMLNRDVRTISSHKCNAMKKLGYKNNNEFYTRGHWMLRDGLYNLTDAKNI